MRKAERAGTVHPERKAQEYLINVYEYLKRGCKEDGARFFSVVPSDRGSEHKLNCRRFPVNIRKHFYCEGNWLRLPREVVECWKY